MQYHRPPIVPSDVWGSRRPQGKPSPNLFFQIVAGILVFTTIVLVIAIVGDLVFN